MNTENEIDSDNEIETLKNVLISLESLYQDKPEIAGEYFGAALTEHIKFLINKALQSSEVK